MRQAIVTKFVGPTNRLGSRVIARASAGRMTFHWDHSLGIEDNPARAARLYAQAKEWPGHWHGGGMPDGSGFVFVNSSQSEFMVSSVEHIRKAQEA